MKQLILEAIAADHARLLEFTKKLVAIPTQNPPGKSYDECVEAIVHELTQIGLEYRIVEVPDHSPGDEQMVKRKCILSSFGGGEKTLYFHGHYDVVPAARANQFVPILKKENLFGRGSSDMKSGLAAMIYAVKAIKSSGIELQGNICLTIVPDEETGGVLGSNYLADEGILGKNGVAMLTPEPTSGVVWNANRGAISQRITVKGKPAHVGLHYKGINAFETMFTVASALMELKREVETRTTEYTIHPDRARRSILMMGGESGGGTSFNLVPGEFSFTVDRRINPEEDLAVEKQRLLSLLDGLKRDGIDLDVETLQEGESAGTSEDHTVARTLARCVKAVRGKQPQFEMCPGLLETRFYVRVGVPAFAYGPGLLSVSHGPDEYVRVKDIYDCAGIYALTALDILSS